MTPYGAPFKKNEILDSKLLTKEIIKVEDKTQTQSGSVEVDQLVARANIYGAPFTPGN
jgi:hypothetical protein